MRPIKSIEQLWAGYRYTDLDMDKSFVVQHIDKSAVHVLYSGANRIVRIGRAEIWHLIEKGRIVW